MTLSLTEQNGTKARRNLWDEDPWRGNSKCKGREAAMSLESVGSRRPAQLEHDE